MEFLSQPWAWGAVAAILAILALLSFGLLLVNRYKRCPSNRILVVYGRTGKGQSAKCIHGGAAFVIPLLQDYRYLSLDPLVIDIPLQDALSSENIRVNVPSTFTVAISTEPARMQNAAVRLLDLSNQAIEEQSRDIIFGQLRQVIASMRIEEINRDRDAFLEKIQANLEPELAKIGLELINVNIRDLTDGSGYIEAIGRKAAAEAVQQAQADVAEQERIGQTRVADENQQREVQIAAYTRDQEVGVATAEKDKLSKIAEQQAEQAAAIADAQQRQRIAVANADATAKTGEYEAQADIAQAQANLDEAAAQAYERGQVADRVAKAKVVEAEHDAMAKAAEAEGRRTEAKKRAELVAVAKAQKAQLVVDAEAAAEQVRLAAQAEAEAIFAKLEAEARGQYEILAKKGEGLKKIVEACGGSDEAFKLMTLEHLDHLAETSAEAVKSFKLDKVVLWDSGRGGGENGDLGALPRFMRDLVSSVPPLAQVAADVAGIDLPQHFGEIANGKTDRTASTVPVDHNSEPETPAASDDADERV